LQEKKCIKIKEFEMRPQIRKFVEVCSSYLKLSEPIIEIGSKRHPSQNKLADLRPLFSGRSFVGCDMEEGPGVDRIENLEKLTFEDRKVGTFILCDTLEHVRNLNIAMKELDRCLKPDSGVIIATSVMHFPVHAFPNDYWRFTQEGFRELAMGFRWVATFFGGDPSFPHTVAFIACRQTPDQIILMQNQS
jgi:SAM-dependent methyltransferase